jgi:hypothetical protein
LNPWLPVGGGSFEIPEFQIDKIEMLLPDGKRLSWVKTFADIAPGECGILVGSTGLIEIASFNQSAQAITKLAIGDPVSMLV